MVKPPARGRAPTGRLLVGLPFIPGPRGRDARATAGLLRALPPAWDAKICVAGPDAGALRRLAGLRRGPWTLDDSLSEQFAAALKRAAARDRYDAILIVDDSATRPAAIELSEFARHCPLVVAVTDEPAAHSPRARLAAPAQVWRFGSDGAAAPPAGLLPRAFFARRAPDARWVARRFEEIRRRGVPPPAPRRFPASLIIPCWNGWPYTRECLSSVRRWTAEPYEVLLVDNGSGDGTAAKAAALGDPHLRVIRNASNRGFAAAINQGMEAARGAHLVWLNNDTIVTPGWLDRLVAASERAPWVGAVGPCTGEINGLQKVPAPYRDLSSLPQFAEARALMNAGRVTHAHRLAGFCFLVKREAVRRVGLLDENFGQGCYEDFDYCLRLRQAGYELLVAEDVFIHHHGHKTFEGNGVSSARARAVNREIFIDKWCRRALVFLDDVDPALPRRRDARE